MASSDTADGVLERLERWAEKHPSDAGAQGVDAEALYGVRATIAAEKARADQAEADCAALRKALESVAEVFAVFPAGGVVHDSVAKVRAALARVAPALATDSGKRLLEEHAAEVRHWEAKWLQEKTRHERTLHLLMAKEPSPSPGRRPEP